MCPRSTRDDRGFILIELLIVMLIIGILAAVAMPSLMRQRQKAWDVAVESDLRNAAIAQDAFLTAGGPGQYAVAVGQLISLGFRPSADSQYFGGAFAMGIGSSGGHYCLTARSQSGRYLAHSSQMGSLSRDTAFDTDTCA